MIDIERVHEYLKKVDPNSEEYFLLLELLAHERAKGNDFNMAHADPQHDLLQR